MEDEVGIANVIFTPDHYERDRVVETQSRFLLVEGLLQNQDGVIHVTASRRLGLCSSGVDLPSHDFH
jgi:error-prone DNA polymerase